MLKFTDDDITHIAVGNYRADRSKPFGVFLYVAIPNEREYEFFISRDELEELLNFIDKEETN